MSVFEFVCTSLCEVFCIYFFLLGFILEFIKRVFDHNLCMQTSGTADRYSSSSSSSPHICEWYVYCYVNHFTESPFISPFEFPYVSQAILLLLLK